MTPPRALLSSLLLSSGVLAATLAQAAEAPQQAAVGAPREAVRVQLDYHREPGASTCVSPEQLMSAVEQRLGRRVFAPAGAAELSAQVRASRSGGRFSIEIALFDRAHNSLGTRRLSTRARHCSALDDSVALVLSLAADMPRDELAFRAESVPAEPPTVEAPVEARPVEPPTAAPSSNAASAAPARASLETPLEIPEDTHAARLGMRFEPELGAAIASGLLPQIGYGLELGFTLRPSDFWPVSLRGIWWAGQREELSNGARGARFSVQTLEVGICPWTGGVGPFSLSACALQWFSRSRGRGFGFAQEEESTAWLLHFGAGATLSQRVGPLFVAVSGAALVPAVRRRYFFTEAAADARDFILYEQPWLSLSAALRVGTEI